MTNTVTMSLEDAEKILEAFETDDWQKKLQAAITLRAALENQSLSGETAGHSEGLLMDSYLAMKAKKEDPQKHANPHPDRSGYVYVLPDGNFVGVICNSKYYTLSEAGTAPIEQHPIAEVTVSHVRPGPNGLYTAEVESEERLSVGAELFLHAQNLRCKSTQKRLATLWGYEKSNMATPETSTEDQSIIDALIKVLQLEIINDGCMVIARTKIPHRFRAQVSLGGTSYTEAKQQAVLQVVEQIQRALKVCSRTL